MRQGEIFATAKKAILGRGLTVYLLLGIIVISYFLSISTDNRYFTNDVAQYISTAQQFSLGNGFSTEVLYYEIQHSQGIIPAPTTTWPIGYPFIISILSFLDGGADQACLFVGYFSLLTVALLVFLKVRSMTSRVGLAGLSALVYLCFVFGWIWARSGLATLPYILLSFMACGASMAWSTSILSNRPPQVRETLWIAILLSSAFYISYSAIFFVVAAGFLLLMMFPRLKSQKWCLHFVVFSIPIMLAISMAFGRNLFFTGTFLSRSSGHTQGSIIEFAENFGRALATMLGISLTEIGHGRLVAVLPLVGLILVVSLFAIRFRHVIRRREYWMKLGPAYSFVIVYLCALTILGASRDPEYASVRYLYTILPFIFLIVTGTIVGVGEDRAIFRTQLIALVGVGLMLIGQVFVVENYWRDGNLEKRMVVDSALARAELIFLSRGESLFELNAPVFADEAQMVWLSRRAPVVGIAESRFSRTDWDEQALRLLVNNFEIKHGIIFKGVIESDQEERFSNQPVIEDIRNGVYPDFVRLVFEDRDVILVSFGHNE